MPSKAAAYAGITIAEGEPHQSRFADCTECRVKINGECAACVTRDEIFEGLDLARAQRPRPSAAVLTLLKEAKDARDRRDYPRAFVAARDAIALLSRQPG